MERFYSNKSVSVCRSCEVADTHRRVVTRIESISEAWTNRRNLTWLSPWEVFIEFCHPERFWVCKSNNPCNRERL